MDTKELRIGNYVKYKGEMLQIDGIQPGWVWFKPDVIMRSDSLRDLKPIPLSPEVLEACGFIKLHSDPDQMAIEVGERAEFRYYHDKQDRRFIKWFPDGADIDGYWFPIENTTTLHQLQNLYYSLTGSELTVNLTQKV